MILNAKNSDLYIDFYQLRLGARIMRRVVPVTASGARGEGVVQQGISCG